jgi:hypothetical protein
VDHLEKIMQTDDELKPLFEGNEGEFRPFTEEFEHTNFEGVEQVTVELTLMGDTWKDFIQECEAQGWKQNEGLIVLLTTGLAYLHAERALTTPETVAGLRDAEVNKLLSRLIEVESRFGAMKYFAYDIMRDHRVMELQHEAIKLEANGYHRLAARLKEENLAFRAEIEQLKRELAKYQALIGPIVEPTPDTRNRWRRAFDVLVGRPDHA